MLESLYWSFKNTFGNTLPMIFVSLVLVISLRLTYLYKNKIKFEIYKEVLLLFFTFYCLCLFQIVTSSDSNASGTSNFIPFKEIMRYSSVNDLFIKNVIGNILLFLPYGYFVGKFFAKDSKLLSVFLILLASVSVEFTQLYIGRVFDVDDIILNVIGGFIGYFIYLSTEKIFGFLPNFFRSKTFLNIVFSILFIIFTVFLVMLFI